VSISDVNCCIKLQIPDISSSRLRRDNFLFFSQTKSGLRMYECIPPIRRYSEFGENRSKNEHAIVNERQD